jgi:hypothetical protein
MSGTLAPVAPPSDEPANTPAPQNRWGDDDPDVIALREAQAEIAREATPGEQETATTPPQAEPPAAAAPPAPTPGSVPYARFRELNQQAQRMAEEVAYWKGVAEARAAGQQAPQAPPQTQQAAQPDPIEQIRAGETALLEAVAKWEGGDLSAADLEVARMQALTSILDARDNIFVSRLLPALAERIDAALARPGLVDSRALEVQITTLEARHPWLQVLSDEDIAGLEAIAKAEATARRQAFPAGPAGLAALRQRVAALSDTYGPQWYPGTTPPAPAAAPPATATPQPPASSAQAGLRPTPEQVRANLERQAAHPPNDPTGRTGGDVTLTIDRLDGMTDEQIEHGGTSVNQLRALLGLSPRN